jgi:hypothetical protein
MSEGLRIGTHQYLDSIEFNKNYAAGLIPERNAVPFIRYKNSVVSSRPQTGIGGSPTITAAANTTNITPIKGYQTWLFTKNAGDAQGEGWSVPFSVDLSGRAKVMKIEFDYMVASGTFNAGSTTVDSDLIVYIYDIDAAQLIEPSSFKLFSNSTTLTDKFSGYFQTSATSTNYRLILHVASTNASAWALEVDNISISQSQYGYGTPITDWVSYTPAITTATGTMTNFSSSGFWRRVGSDIELKGRIIFNSNTVGTWTGPEVGLPSGLNIDFTTAVSEPSTNIIRTGTLTILNDGVSSNIGVPIASSTVSLNKFRAGGVLTTKTDDAGSANDPLLIGSSILLSNTFPFTPGVNDVYFWNDVRFPIQGWSSSVRMSDGFEARDVSTYAYRTANQTGINTNNSAVKILLNTTDASSAGRGYDTAAQFESANNRIIIRAAGKYDIKGQISTLGANVLANAYYAQVFVNGSFILRGQYVFPTSGQEFSISVGSTLDLNAGDYVELFLFGVGNNSVNTITVTSGPGSTFLIAARRQSPQTTAQGEVVAASYFNTTGTTPGPDYPGRTLVTYNNRSFDTHNMYNMSTGVGVIPFAGVYLITASVLLDRSSGSIGDIASTIIRINSSDQAENALRIPVTGSNTVSPHASLTRRLNAGDTFSVYCYITGSTRSNPGNTLLNYLNIQRIG